MKMKTPELITQKVQTHRVKTQDVKAHRVKAGETMMLSTLDEISSVGGLRRDESHFIPQNRTIHPTSPPQFRSLYRIKVTKFLSRSELHYGSTETSPRTRSYETQTQLLRWLAFRNVSKANRV